MSIVALGILALLFFELISDVAIAIWMGGWSLIVLPFVIFLQVAFDFILLAMIGFYSYSRKTRVIH